MEDTPDLFAQLPKEIILSVYDYLLPEDLSRACGACHKWNLLMSSDLLWQKFVALNKSTKKSNGINTSNDQDYKPFKWVYINRKVNWLHGDVEQFEIEGHSPQGGSFYIAHMLSGQNILVTGSRGDIMEEWDLVERKLIKAYEVPTGPASNYRMDDNILVINRSSLVRWKRHEQATRFGSEDEFTFKLDFPVASQDTYKFSNERLLLVGSDKIRMYDMNTGQQMWVTEGTDQRVSWNGVDMDYNRAAIATPTHLKVLDLNNGNEILRIDYATLPLNAICKLNGNLVCYAAASEISMVDLRNPGQKLWSNTLSLTDGYSYSLRSIYFDEFKCILGTFDKFMFFDSHTGKLLYTKACPGMLDFACNDEYLAAVSGRATCIFDFTKRAPVVVRPTEEQQLQQEGDQAVTLLKEDSSSEEELTDDENRL